MSARSLVIRPFVEGRDEQAWISISNEYLGHFYGDDYTPIGQEDMEWSRRAPWYDPSEMFVAELSGEPIGILFAHVDKLGRRREGIIGVRVRLRYVGSEHERSLILLALEDLRSRGILYARIWVRDNMAELIRLLEREGFKRIRTFSTMKMRLSELRHGIGECERVRFRPMERTRHDIGLFTYLANQAFKEHFGFIPQTVAETEAFLNRPGRDIHVILAYWGKTPVGYVELTVSHKLLKQGKRTGEVSSIGVLRPYRCLGIGTALMLEGLEWLRERGMEEAELVVDDDNPTKAMKLYEKVGFKVAYKDFVYERPTS